MKKENQENKADYYNQLTDYRWYKKRASIISKANHSCQKCGSKVGLVVHHIYYVKGKKAWQYPNTALQCLCSKCHIDWHESHRLEFREKLPKGSYDTPVNKDVYYVRQGCKSVRKERPYKAKPKVRDRKHQAKSSLVKAKDRLRAKKARGVSKYGFAPRSKKRLQELN